MAHVDLDSLWHEASFRLVEVYEVEVERGWRIPLARQPYGEVVAVLSGRCRFELAGEAVDVLPGQIGILLPGPDRLTADAGNGPLRFRGFGFRVELHGSIELSGLLGLPLVVSRPWPELVEGVAATVSVGQSGEPADAFRARAHAERTVASLVEHRGDVQALRQAVRPDIAAALALMEDADGRDLDLATVASAAHLSPKHFARTFKAVVGVPPMTYLQAVRVSRARAALTTSDQPVATIAHDHGFADAAHFSRAFRRAFGTTPREFRARARALETRGRSSGSRSGRGVG